ncbi:MAG: sigma-70 family RNA polymerase sigma factor [Candidatus Sericytochromatia bacterium]|nr:sigma-70 family RNA polymerase sigma factor [Candidatus Sericytochromatia bacterium]
MSQTTTLTDDLVAWVANRDPLSRDRILKEHTSIIRRIAHQYVHPGCQVEDLIQVGSIGLLRALDRYNPGQGVAFRTYASHFIVGEIKHYLRDQSPMIRVPRDLSEFSSKMRHAAESLGKSLGREATDAEIAAKLEVPLQRIIDCTQAEQSSLALSLDQEMGHEPGSGKSLGDQVEDKSHHSFQLAQEDRILLGEAMAAIRIQSRQVIEFAFYQDLTQTEISKKLGISQMQVSRRLRSAITELWELLNVRVTPW